MSESLRLDATVPTGFRLRQKLRTMSLRTLSLFATRVYHHWYYSTGVWTTTSWMGIPTLKSPSDMWNYQEIIFELRPTLVVEFGTFRGGSALFFASVMRNLGQPFRILSVDITRCNVSDPDVEFLTVSSSDARVADRIRQLRAAYPGPMFAILDSDHSQTHVLAEMKLLRPLTHRCDYLIVEDSNINGHPVDRSFGPGPFEAIGSYFAEYPNDYVHDSARERKFGFTFATNGFLIRS